MDKRISGNWMSDELVDMLGRTFTVGDFVVRAKTSGRAVNIEIGKVTRIESDKIFLSNSKVPVYYPGRMLIVNEVMNNAVRKD
jgi:hypothetical protein